MFYNFRIGLVLVQLSVVKIVRLISDKVSNRNLYYKDHDLFDARTILRENQSFNSVQVIENFLIYITAIRDLVLIQ